MATFNVEVQGLDIVKKLFSDIENQLSAAQLRGILDEAGKVIISQAKSEIPYTGTISEDFKKDLGVYRDRRKSAKNAEYVLVGPRFKPYTIHGKEQKVAVIAQHMTQGFSQSEQKRTEAR
jgi:orotate phosphoribosyltransferase-like protein